MSNIPTEGRLLSNNNIESINSEIIFDTIEHYIGVDTVDNIFQVTDNTYLIKLKDINNCVQLCTLLNKTQLYNNIINVEYLDINTIIPMLDTSEVNTSEVNTSEVNIDESTKVNTDGVNTSEVNIDESTKVNTDGVNTDGVNTDESTKVNTDGVNTDESTKVNTDGVNTSEVNIDESTKVNTDGVNTDKVNTNESTGIYNYIYSKFARVFNVFTSLK